MMAQRRAANNQDQEEEDGGRRASSPVPYGVAKEQLDYLSARSSASPDHHGLPHSYQRTAPYLLWDELSARHLPPSSSSSPTSPSSCSCCCCRAATVVLAVVLLGGVFAVIGTAVYLGVITNAPEMYIVEEEIYEGQMRILSGDRYAAALSDRSSPQFTIKAESYESLLNRAYRGSRLNDAFLRSKVVSFQNSSLVVFFRLHLDRRKVSTRSLQETYDVLHEEFLSSEPAVFKTVRVEAATLNISDIHGQHSKSSESVLENDYNRLADDDALNVTEIFATTAEEEVDATTTTMTTKRADSSEVIRPNTSSSEHENSATETRRENLTSSVGNALVNGSRRTDLSASRGWKPVVRGENATVLGRRGSSSSSSSSGSAAEINFDWEPEEAVSAIFRGMEPKRGGDEELLRGEGDTSREFGFRIHPPKPTAQSRSDDDDAFAFQIDSPRVVIDPDDAEKRRDEISVERFADDDESPRRDDGPATAEAKPRWIPVRPPVWEHISQESRSGEYEQEPPNDDEGVGFGLRLLRTLRAPSQINAEKVFARNNRSTSAVIVKLPPRTRRPAAAVPSFGSGDDGPITPESARAGKSDRGRRPRLYRDAKSAVARSTIRVPRSEARVIASFNQHRNIIVSSAVLHTRPEEDTANEVRVTRAPKLFGNFDLPSAAEDEEERVTSISVKSSSSVIIAPKVFVADGGPTAKDLPATLTSVVTSIEEATIPDSITVEEQPLQSAAVRRPGPMSEIDLSSYSEITDQQSDASFDALFPELLKLNPVLRSNLSATSTTMTESAPEISTTENTPEEVSTTAATSSSENPTGFVEARRSTAKDPVDASTTSNANDVMTHEYRPSLFEQLYSSLFSNVGSIFTDAGYSEDSSDENLVLSTNSEELKNISPLPSADADADVFSTSTAESAATKATTKNKRCDSPTLFQCHSGECVSIFSRCNRMKDCSDNSDEDDCACADFIRANVINSTLCDGVVDCWDYSDENQCDWCSSSMFVCPTARVCVEKEKVCDGVADCPGGEDERACVTVAPNASAADAGDYWGYGLIMIRKEGRWGKLCMENFENFVSETQVATGDLGRVLCQTMGYSDFEEAKQLQDDRSSDDESIYYEPQYNENETNFRSAPSIQFVPTRCHSKEVIRVMCRDFVCGKRHQAIQSRARIVGGSNSTPGSWPWQAAVYKEGNFMCGATLISDQYLISAAHCFYQAIDHYWTVRVGILRRGSFSPYERVHKLSHIVLHPNYISSNFINDIALLRMDEPVRFSDFIRPICLSNTDLTRGSISRKQSCTVVGWGQTDEEGDYLPDTLQEVKLPLISARECRMRTTALTSYARVNDNMFCAGVDHGGHDACLGDSGGPIMCQQPDGRWALTGITSNGFGCARASRPGIYTKVASYIPWIQKVRMDPLGRSVRNFCNGHRCRLGKCLSKRQVCDGFVDCIDGSDETNCPWS